MVDNKGPQLASVCATLAFLAIVSTSLRCYVRIRIVKAFGLDDYFMVGALLTFMWFSACLLGGTYYGTGRHLSDLSADSAKQVFRYWYNCYLAYSSTMTLTKISIGLFFLRFTVSRVHRAIIWTVMVATALTGVVYLFVLLFQCSPIQFFWNRVYPDAKGSCIDINIIITLTYVYGSICTACDLTFGFLPIVLVWNLNMDRKTKLMLVPILGMACIASAAVIARMPYIQDFKNPDFSYAAVDIAIWSTVEAGLAITAGSLACLRPLYRQVMAHLTTKNGTGTSGGNSGKASLPESHPSSKRRRRGVFSLSNLTTQGTRADAEELDDMEYPLQTRAASCDNDAESGTSAGKQNSKRGDQMKIYVTEEFKVHNTARYNGVERESQRDLTALPSAKGIAL